MTSVERHLTPLDLDLLDLAAAAPADRVRIETHATACPDCAARRRQHAERASRFRTTVFPRTAPRLSAGLGRHPDRRLWGLALLPATLGFIVAIQRLGAPHPQPSPASPGQPAPPVIGVKGDALLRVFARRSGHGADRDPEILEISDGTRLAAGDALRFQLPPTGLDHALIVSVDGAGQFSVYFPFRGERSAPVDGRRAFLVPGSIVLDAAPGPERIFAVYSDRPVEVIAVRAALAATAAGGAGAIRAAGSLRIGGALQTSVLIEKEGPR